MTEDVLTRGDDVSYRQALLDRLAGADPVDELAGLFERLPAVLEGVDEADLRRPEREGKWSILEVICHMADAELMQAWRIRRVLTEDRPELSPMDQDVWAARLHHDETSLEDALELLRALRLANLRLARSLSDAELDRISWHAERGEESLRTILAVLAGHDAVHLDQIRRIRSVLEGGAG